VIDFRCSPAKLGLGRSSQNSLQRLLQCDTRPHDADVAFHQSSEPGEVLVCISQDSIVAFLPDAADETMKDLPTAGPVESLNIDHGELHIAVDDVEVEG
jgi:hypothetical protein